MTEEPEVRQESALCRAVGGTCWLLVWRNHKMSFRRFLESKESFCCIGSCKKHIEDSSQRF